ncbi:MAG: response regulator, partial [Nitrobacter sp.]
MSQFSVKRPVVLVVEDEPLIRLNVCDMLEDDGFEVITAANAHKAIEILESRLDIRIIFTDVQMPGTIDGMALVRMTRDRWPPIRIVVASAYNVKQADLPTGGRFLPKPYTSEQVTGIVRA